MKGTAAAVTRAPQWTAPRRAAILKHASARAAGRGALRRVRHTT